MDIYIYIIWIYTYYIYIYILYIQRERARAPSRTLILQHSQALQALVQQLLQAPLPSRRGSPLVRLACSAMIYSGWMDDIFRTQSVWINAQTMVHSGWMDARQKRASLAARASHCAPSLILYKKIIESNPCWRIRLLHSMFFTITV